MIVSGILDISLPFEWLSKGPVYLIGTRKLIQESVGVTVIVKGVSDWSKEIESLSNACDESKAIYSSECWDD